MPEKKNWSAKEDLSFSFHFHKSWHKFNCISKGKIKETNLSLNGDGASVFLFCYLNVCVFVFVFVDLYVPVIFIRNLHLFSVLPAKNFDFFFVLDEHISFNGSIAAYTIHLSYLQIHSLIDSIPLYAR